MYINNVIYAGSKVLQSFGSTRIYTFKYLHIIKQINRTISLLINTLGELMCVWTLWTNGQCFQLKNVDNSWFQTSDPLISSSRREWGTFS